MIDHSSSNWSRLGLSGILLLKDFNLLTRGRSTTAAPRISPSSALIAAILCNVRLARHFSFPNSEWWRNTATWLQANDVRGWVVGEARQGFGPEHPPGINSILEVASN